MSSLLPFIVAGVTAGSVYGLAGTGLVLTYKTSGIFNLAHGATAAAAAYLFHWLLVEREVPWLLAFVVSVVAFGPLVGLVWELIARRVGRQNDGFKIVATLGVILAVQGVTTILFGSTPLRTPQYLPSATETFRFGGVNISYSQATVAAISLLAVVGLYVFFRHSRMGTAMRAVVDDPELVGLHGMRPQLIQRTAWAIGSSFAALSGVLLAPSVGVQAIAMTFLVVQAFGAAAIGSFSSIPLTYAGGIVIGIFASVTTKFVIDIPWLSGFPPSLPFIVLIIALVVIPKRRLVSGTQEDKPMPLPWEAPARWRLAAAAPVLVGLIFVPQLVGLKLPFFTDGLAQAILLLSLGLLVRTAGIVSLCHAAFAAVGAVAYAQFVAQFNVPTLLAMLLAGLVAVPVAALLALPAVRLSGLFLALVTLGFGLMMEQMLYPTSFMFTSVAQGRAMPRPSFAESDTAYYYFVLACFVAVAVFIAAIHHARIGRLLRGMGGSPVAMQTLGMDLNVTRIVTFCISGFIAAIAGVLYGAGANFIALGNPRYTAFTSLVLVAMLAVMPFREPWYAIVAFVSVVIPAYWDNPNSSEWLSVLFGVSAIVIAMQGGTQTMPEGLRRRLDRLLGSKRADPEESPRVEPRTEELPEVVERPGDGLDVEELTVRFGGNVAVSKLSLHAPLASITGVIGPNGAGKSTTFNAVSGLVRPSAGTVRFDSGDLSRVGIAGRARRGIGRTFQTMQLCDGLSVADNVMLGYEAGRGGRSVKRQLWASHSERDAGRRAAEEALELCGITDIADRQAGSLSTGQRRLVELARCLAGDFDILLLDEPSSGLDAAETQRFGDLLLHVVETRGCGMLLVEHDMSLVLRVCSNIYVLDFGTLVYSGAPDDIRTSEVVRDAYLGSADHETAGSGQS